MYDSLFLLVLSHYFLKLKYMVKCCISLHRVVDSEPPALCGSSWPFLPFMVLMSCLGLGAHHGAWGGVKGGSL